MKDILICGYYGFKNSGDDALLLSIIQQLKGMRADIKISVLSNNPEETIKKYGVDAKKRDGIFSLITAVMGCKMLILGGGTLIQDRTSTKSLVYYLAVVILALIFGKKVMLYANGIGPLKNKKITAKILNRVDLITLRDKNSLAELKEMGVKKPRIELTADSVFGLDFIKKPTPFEGDYFCVSIRDYNHFPKDFCEQLAKVCDYISQEFNCYPLFIPFQHDKDLEITEKISSMTKKGVTVTALPEPDDLISILSGARLCIGMRLHSLIYSALCAVPLIGLVYDPKVSGFLDYMGENKYFDVERLSSDELINAVNDCFENNSKIRLDMGKKLEKMKELAKKNAQLAIELPEE